MTDSVEHNAPLKKHSWDSPWAIVAVLAVAILLRLAGIGQWSLWQDEEMSIYFSQVPQHLFVRCFAPFFVVLGWVYDLCGISVEAGRMLAGLFGLIGIWLTYGFCRKHISRDVGLVVAILLTVALGHVFWSQSIRYYTMVTMAQMASIWLFYEGIEENRYWKLVLSGAAFTFGMYVHFTAVLILPVYAGYLMLVFALRQQTTAYRWKPIAFFFVLLLLGLALIMPNYLALKQSGALGQAGGHQFQAPLPLLARFVAYYGVPMFGLALLSPLFWKSFSKRAYLLVLSLGIIPILELLVIGAGSLAIVCWYHAFVSMLGVAALAGVTLVGGYRNGWHKAAAATGLVSLLYYGGFLFYYYTDMHGDRERWHDGAAYVRQTAGIDAAATDNPAIYATVPEVVGYYLGVSPDRARPEGPLVLPISAVPPKEPGAEPAWYLVKASHVTPQYKTWFRTYCEHKAEFRAHTLNVDRSMHVYYWPGTQAFMNNQEKSVFAHDGVHPTVPLPEK